MILNFHLSLTKNLEGKNSKFLFNFIMATCTIPNENIQLGMVWDYKCLKILINVLTFKRSGESYFRNVNPVILQYIYLQTFNHTFILLINYNYLIIRNCWMQVVAWLLESSLHALIPWKATDPDAMSLKRKECALLGRELCEGGSCSRVVRR